MLAVAEDYEGYSTVFFAHLVLFSADLVGQLVNLTLIEFLRIYHAHCLAPLLLFNLNSLLRVLTVYLPAPLQPTSVELQVLDPIETPVIVTEDRHSHNGIKLG